MKEKMLNSHYATGRFSLLAYALILLVISFISSFFLNSQLFCFQESRTLFICSNEYFHDFLSKPGGVLEYAGVFITQGYHNRATGSMILGAVLLMSFYTIYFANAYFDEDHKSPVLFTMLPICILLISQNSYNHLIHYTLGYLVSISYSLIYISARTRTLKLILLIMLPLFYIIAGIFVLVFAGFYVSFTLKTQTGVNKLFRSFSVILYVAFFFILFREFVYNQPDRVLLLHPFSGSQSINFPFLFLVLAAYSAFLPFLLKSGLLYGLASHLSGFISTISLILLTLVVVFIQSKHVNSSLSEMTSIEKSVAENDWESVKRKYKNSSSSSLQALHYYNLALANKNELCDELFSVKQSYGSESLILPRTEEYINSSYYFYYTVGLIGEAHHMAYEAFVRYGYTPEILRMLIKTNLLKQDYRVAENHINTLSKTLNYRKQSQYYREILSDPALIISDSDMGEKMKMQPEHDFFIRKDDVQNLELFIMSNSKNKRAFEYKMARLLLDKDIETMIYEIKQMRSISYTSLPGHIEEAILMYKKVHKSIPDLGEFEISPRTVTRFEEYNQAVDSLRILDNQHSRNNIRSKYGDTFWYYYQFE